MSLTASELLTGLEQSGSARETIEMGRKFVRLMQTEDPQSLLDHFQQQRVTTGTIDKARSLLSGRTKPEDYQGKPPTWSRESEHQQLAKMLGQEMGRVMEESQTRQAEKQAEASAIGIGDPLRSKSKLTAR